MRPTYPVPALAQALAVSLSGYYAWRTRPPSRRQREDARLAVEITAAHRRTRESYSAERLQADLADHGVHVGVCRIKRLRRELGIRCRQKKRFKATTNSNHGLPVAQNLVSQNFAAAAPNQMWLTDITYIPTNEGWLYLAGHKDICTGEIVGYAMSDRMTRNLVSESLFKAVTVKRPAAGLIHHSDRGSQYCSREYRKLLHQFKMKSSMSRRGDCYDNAPIESFWGTLKTELTFHRDYQTRQEAKCDIQEYIEIFYNRQRKQKKLGYLSPAAYERRFYQMQKAA
jgi:transposase InsO family protein